MLELSYAECYVFLVQLREHLVLFGWSKDTHKVSLALCTNIRETNKLVIHIVKV